MTAGLLLLATAGLLAVFAGGMLYSEWRGASKPATSRPPLPGERWHSQTLGLVEIVGVTPNGRIIRYQRATLDPAPICYCSQEAWEAAGMTVCTLDDLEEHHTHGKPL